METLSISSTKNKNEQRVAIVTGASRGIGRAISRRLANDGCIVALIARDESSLAEVQSEIEDEGGVASCHVCDLQDSEVFATTIKSIIEQYNRLDILINNAGMTRDGLLLRMTDEDFDAVINVNLKAVFAGCRTVAKPMMKGRWGRMINITSVTGLSGNAGQANYAAAKAGLVGLTKTLAKEFGSKGITANAVAPGFIETDMTANLGDNIRNSVESNLPLRRYGQPEEIAAAVSFLASEDASYITGQVVVVDGGLTC